jgi:hypothetical protein
MLSERYKFNSEALFDQYVDRKINFSQYEEQLNILKASETKGFLVNKEDVLDQIDRYESINHQSIMKRSMEDRDEEKRKKSLSPRERYYEDEIPQIIREYREQSNFYRNLHNLFQWIIIIGSVIVTSATGATIVTDTVGISQWFKWAAAFLSILVSISAGATGYYKFKEKSNNLQEAADDIEREYKSLNLGIGEYRGRDSEEALLLFAEKTDSRITEQKKKQQLLEQPSDTKQGLIQIQSK